MRSHGGPLHFKIQSKGGSVASGQSEHKKLLYIGKITETKVMKQEMEYTIY